MKNLHRREPGTVPRNAAAILKSPARHARQDDGDFLLGLQRTAGNAAVASWLSTLNPTVQAQTAVKTAIKPKAKAKPKPKAKAKPKLATLQVTIDDKGMVHTNDAAATLIGFTDGSGTTFVEKHNDKASGTFFETDDTQVVLTKLHKVDVAPTGADGTAVVTFTPTTMYALLTDAEAGAVVDMNGKPLPAAPSPRPLSTRCRARCP